MATKKVPGIMAPARKKPGKTAKPKPAAKPGKKTKGPSYERMHVHVLVDKSGSMTTCIGSTIAGVNGYMNDLSAGTVPTTVTLQTFDSGGYSPALGSNLRKETIAQTAPIQTAPRLGTHNYRPEGGTPLHDAIGTSVREIENLWLGTSTRVALVIMTDGMENTSKEFDIHSVRRLLEQKQAEGWLVVYLGANQDAVAVGRAMGTSAMNSMTYGVGNEAVAMAASARSTKLYAAGASASASGFTEEERKKATI